MREKSLEVELGKMFCFSQIADPERLSRRRYFFAGSSRVAAGWDLFNVGCLLSKTAGRRERITFWLSSMSETTRQLSESPGSSFVENMISEDGILVVSRKWSIDR